MFASEPFSPNPPLAGRAAQVAAARAPDVASHRRGQSLIELAIVLPLLVVIVLLALDLGRAFFAQVALRGAAEYGVRYAASFPSKTKDQIQEQVRDEPGGSIVRNEIDVYVYPDVYPPDPPRRAGTEVKVKATYKFKFISPFSEALAGLVPDASDKKYLLLQSEAISVVIAGAS